jgi:perosamine synthetase
MGKLDSLLAERRRRAHGYLARLSGSNELALPMADPSHTFQSFVVRLREGGRARRNAVMARLAAADIQTRPGTHAVHRLGYYRNKYGLAEDACPNAALAEDTTITLPIFPGMTDADQTRVVEVLTAATR